MTGEIVVVLLAYLVGSLPTALLLVWLVKDHGLWRVTHLGFDRLTRVIAGS